MSHSHVCVWIDHYQAKVFGIGAGDADLAVIKDDGPNHHIHRKADHVGLGTDAVDPDFLDDVAGALTGAKGILICGPGGARHQLAGYLHDRYPATAKHIWGIEPMDHPTDREIAAAARVFFHAAVRMRA